MFIIKQLLDSGFADIARIIKVLFVLNVHPPQP